VHTFSTVIKMIVGNLRSCLILSDFRSKLVGLTRIIACCNILTDS
jgi:hypothetical protein